MANNNLSSVDKMSAGYYYPDNVGVKDRQWSLLAGAGMTLWGLLGGGLKQKAVCLSLGGYLLSRAVTGQCTFYRWLGYSSAAGDVQSHIVIEKSVVVNRPITETYRFWRNLAQLPHYLHYIESAVPLDDEDSTWKFISALSSPRYSEWTVKLNRDIAPVLIAYHALPDSNLEVRGSLRFTELSNGSGTEVNLTIAYAPRGGELARTLASMKKTEIEQEVKNEMLRLKYALEVGDVSVATTLGQSGSTLP